MSSERAPVLLVLCGSLNPITVGHLKMFEIARNFMERMGTHAVIGGVLSPVHDGYKKPGLLPAKHRLEMCRLATQTHPWLRVDSWESDQPEWAETICVLRHQVEELKKLFRVGHLHRQSESHSPCNPTQTVVTLQPDANGFIHIPISCPIRSSASGQNAVSSFYNFARSSSKPPSVCDLIDKNESLELNEASEHTLHDKTGIALGKLSQDLKRMCCSMPIAFDFPERNTMYGATCDFRRTKVMLLCGGDLLESFAKPGLWKEEHIREIVSDFGIVCIPRQQTDGDESTLTDCGISTSNGKREDGAERMRKALSRLQEVTKNISGTIILVNDIRSPEIARISSSRCRNAIRRGSSDVNSLVAPSVLNYIQRNNLYVAQVAA